MIKRILLPLLVATAIALSNCVSAGMIVNMTKSQPVGQWLQIHKNPRVGDQITLISGAGKSTMRIASVENGIAEVVQSVGDYAVEYHIFVDRNGNVKKASIWNLDSGEKFDLRIAGSESDVGYIVSKKKLKLDKPTTLKTVAGEFKVNEVLVVNLAGTIKQAVYLLNSDVNFGYVKMSMYKQVHSDADIKALNPANEKGFGLTGTFNTYQVVSE